jgi:hypothetical protein
VIVCRRGRRIKRRIYCYTRDKTQKDGAMPKLGDARLQRIERKDEDGLGGGRLWRRIVDVLLGESLRPASRKIGHGAFG